MREDLTQSDHLLDLWAKNICPYCGQTIPEDQRVGSGRKSDGGFCSFGCYADYYKLELQQRARRVAQMARRHGNS